MVKILAHNTTSLVRIARRKEMEKLHKEKGVDFSLLQETHLSKRYNLYVEGCKVFRNDGGVGTAVVVKNGMRAQRHIIDGLEVIEHCAVKVRTTGGEMALIVSIYVPCINPATSLRKGLRTLEEEAEKFDRFMLGGDWNGRHPAWNERGDPAVNANGSIIQKWLSDNPNMKLTCATRNTFRDKSMLDFFVGNVGACRGPRPMLTCGWDTSPLW